MVLQDKYGSIWEAHQTQILPMIPWIHVIMGVVSLEELIAGGELDIFQGRAYSYNPNIDPHQVSRFCSGLHPI